MKVTADGKIIASQKETNSSSNHGTSYLYYGLEDGRHQITVQLESGNFVLDAILPLGKIAAAVVELDKDEEEIEQEGKGCKKDILCMEMQKIVLKTKKIKKSIRISWKRIKDADGYILQLAKGKKGRFRVLKKLSGNKKCVYRDKKVKKKIWYRYRVCGYKKSQGEKLYSRYSGSKKIRL